MAESLSNDYGSESSGEEGRDSGKGEVDGINGSDPEYLQLGSDINVIAEHCRNINTSQLKCSKCFV